ncbi:UNVERIFIED_ORG: hypothetical protein ABIC72_002668 [Burkholderia sp. 1988]|nr:hypothetical protein [Paraburkholderia terricola]
MAMVTGKMARFPRVMTIIKRLQIKMLSLNEMLKELGSVTVRYSGGVYQAESGNLLARGHPECSNSAEGAVWNMLLLKRECEARERGGSNKRSALGISIPGRFGNGIDADAIPTAGQDSY